MLKKIALVIFTKTPGVSPVKTRLAKDIGIERANEFFLKSIQTTKKVLKSIKIEEIETTVIFALAEKNLPQHKIWCEERTIYQGEGNLGDKLANVYQKLISEYDGVLFFGGDSAHMRVDQLIRAIELLENNFVLGKTRDGGFYLFAGSGALDPLIWRQVQYSEDQTFNQLKKSLNKIKNVQEVTEDFDIDTVEDLNMYTLIDRSNLKEFQLDFVDWVLNRFEI